MRVETLGHGTEIPEQWLGSAIPICNSLLEGSQRSAEDAGCVLDGLADLTVLCSTGRSDVPETAEVTTSFGSSSCRFLVWTDALAQGEPWRGLGGMYRSNQAIMRVARSIAAGKLRTPCPSCG